MGKTHRKLRKALKEIQEYKDQEENRTELKDVKSKKFQKAVKYHTKRDRDNYTRSKMEITSFKNNYFRELQVLKTNVEMNNNNIAYEEDINYHECIIRKPFKKPTLKKIIDNLLNMPELWIDIMYGLHYRLISTDVYIHDLSPLFDYISQEKSITKDTRLINYVYQFMEKIKLIKIDKNTGYIGCVSTLFCDLIRNCQNLLKLNSQIDEDQKTIALEKLNSIDTMIKEILNIFKREKITLYEVLHTLYCYLRNTHITSDKAIKFDWLMIYQDKIGSIKLISILLAFLKKIGINNILCNNHTQKKDLRDINATGLGDILPLHKSWKEFVKWYNRQIKKLNLQHDFMFIVYDENTVCKKMKPVYPVMVVDPRFICC